MVTDTVLYQLRYRYGGKCNDDFNHCITISSRFYIQLHRLTGTTTNKNNKRKVKPQQEYDDDVFIKSICFNLKLIFDSFNL